MHDTLVGVDGCRGGWFAAFADAKLSQVESREFERFADLLEVFPQATIAIDIPIGLLDSGSRGCDEKARQFLQHRRSSVFTAPIRGVLPAPTHADASRIRREVEGKGMSIQAFLITGKIRDVDSALQNSVHATRVHEVHPEVSFARLNDDKPLTHSKKTLDGRNQRIALLDQVMPGAAARLVRERRRHSVAADDVLDALAVLWTASRIANGAAIEFSSEPSHDGLNLRMSIWS